MPRHALFVGVNLLWGACVRVGVCVSISAALVGVVIIIIIIMGQEGRAAPMLGQGHKCVGGKFAGQKIYDIKRYLNSLEGGER